MCVGLAKDEKVAEKMKEKNQFETYAYSLKSSMDVRRCGACASVCKLIASHFGLCLCSQDKKFSEKMEPGDKDKLQSAIDTALNWLKSSDTAEKV
jgi:hypothetical protein